MTVVVGTPAAEPGTMTGEIYERWDALIAALPDPPTPEVLAQIAPGVKRLFNAVAYGVVEEFVDGIGEGLYLRVVGGELVGATASGGGDAPSDAQYLVAASNGDLTAERVATNTATVTWDFATAGQAKANVPSATTSAEGVVELATDGQTSSGVAVQGSDSRLAQATTSNRGTSVLSADGGTTASQVVQANDGRVRGFGQSSSRVVGSTSRGNTNNLVLRWVSHTENFASPDLTYTSNFQLGNSWLVNNDGIYTVSVSVKHPNTFQNVIAIKTGTLNNTFSDSQIRAVAQVTSGGFYAQASWTGRVPSGDRIWIAVAVPNNLDNSDSNLNTVTVARIR